MDITHNIAGWFGIPVTNIDRAINFYETVLDIKLSRNMVGPLDMAWFPFVENSIGSGGSLVFHTNNNKFSADDVLILLTVFSGDLNNELS
jgi:predicted enzyme related to lactoylglutathione lyase